MISDDIQAISHLGKLITCRAFDMSWQAVFMSHSTLL